MRIRSRAAAATIGFMILLAQGVTAETAEVTILSASAMAATLRELGPEFERATGHKLVMKFVLGPVVKRDIDAGEVVDVAISTSGVIDDLIKEAKIVAGTRVDIARSGMGVAVRAGAPKPDITSVDAFKRALLNAKSITYAKGGATGVYLEKLLERLGIADEMQRKTKLQETVGQAAQAVADGEAELAFMVVSNILPLRGVELLGPFPLELQNYVVFTAGVGAAAKEPAAAKALIEFLTAPTAVPVIKAKGMEPR